MIVKETDNRRTTGAPGRGMGRAHGNMWRKEISTIFALALLTSQI
jgi:hypothetical protein